MRIVIENPPPQNSPAASPGVTGDVQFRLATVDDDADLRKLLRETPMDGDIRLTLEREPSYFAAATLEGPEHRTIVAVEGRQLVCAGSISARMRYVNGKPVRVGYLGGLRLHSSCRNRMSIIRGGYRHFRAMHDQTPAHSAPAIYLTSIAADNLPARRLLERGLPGMPVYRFLGELVTLVISRRRNSDLSKPTSSARRRLREMDLSVHYGSEPLIPEIIELLNRRTAAYQFAPIWTADDLMPQRYPGLSSADFRLARSAAGTPIACAAFWDQSAVKQTIVRGYAPWLRRLRPFLNLGVAICGRPTLPAAGKSVRHAFVSHVAVDPDQPVILEQLIRLFHGPAFTRGIDYLTLGFDARDPRLVHLRKAFRPREYRSRLYAVHWDDAGDDFVRTLDDRLLAPEVALL